MAKVQTRRTVGMNRQVYEDLKRYCSNKEVSMSRFVEELVQLAILHGWAPSKTASKGTLFTRENQPTGVVIY